MSQVVVSSAVESSASSVTVALTRALVNESYTSPARYTVRCLLFSFPSACAGAGIDAAQSTAMSMARVVLAFMLI